MSDIKRCLVCGAAAAPCPCGAWHHVKVPATPHFPVFDEAEEEAP